jgi:hypothetical protein
MIHMLIGLRARPVILWETQHAAYSTIWYTHSLFRCAKSHGAVQGPACGFPKMCDTDRAQGSDVANAPHIKWLPHLHRPTCKKFQSCGELRMHFAGARQDIITSIPRRVLVGEIFTTSRHGISSAAASPSSKYRFQCGIEISLRRQINTSPSDTSTHRPLRRFDRHCEATFLATRIASDIPISVRSGYGQENLQLVLRCRNMWISSLQSLKHKPRST